MTAVYLLSVICLAELAMLFAALRDGRTERVAAAQYAAAERAELLQRIQSPEQAVIQHQIQHLPPDPAPLPFDDDTAFHASREDMLAAVEANMYAENGSAA